MKDIHFYRAWPYGTYTRSHLHNRARALMASEKLQCTCMYCSYGKNRIEMKIQNGRLILPWFVPSLQLRLVDLGSFLSGCILTESYPMNLLLARSIGLWNCYVAVSGKNRMAMVLASRYEPTGRPGRSTLSDLVSYRTSSN